jgi:hypothetical protein
VNKIEIEAIAEMAAETTMQGLKKEPETGHACTFEGWLDEDDIPHIITTSKECKDRAVKGSDKGIRFEYIDPEKLDERAKEIKLKGTCKPCEEAYERLKNKLLEQKAEKQTNE